MKAPHKKAPAGQAKGREAVCSEWILPQKPSSRNPWKVFMAEAGGSPRCVIKARSMREAMRKAGHHLGLNVVMSDDFGNAEGIANPELNVPPKWRNVRFEFKVYPVSAWQNNLRIGGLS